MRERIRSWYFLKTASAPMAPMQRPGGSQERQIPSVDKGGLFVPLPNEAGPLYRKKFDIDLWGWYTLGVAVPSRGAWSCATVESSAIRLDPWKSAARGSLEMKNIVGRKIGMTNVFTPDGRSVPVTVIEAGPCVVLQRKTVENDGYEAVALAFGEIKRARLTKPQAGRFQKANLEPKAHVREFRRGIDGVAAGEMITVAGFESGDRVDVVGTSKGHGFSGGIKRWNFSGGGASHGSMIHRQPGSNGDTNSGHTPRGSHRPGHFGVDRTTHQNLEVVRADVERNLLLVRGPVPGARDGIVIVSAAVRPPKTATRAKS